MPTHSPHKGSRYVWNCSYEELIKRPLVRKAYRVIMNEKGKEGELTTAKVHKKLEENYDVDRAKNTVLTCLNTMCYYNIIKGEEPEKEPNIVYWSLGEKTFPKEWLIAERDKKLIDGSTEADYINSFSHSLSRLSLYGFPNNKFLESIQDISLFGEPLIEGNLVEKIEEKERKILNEIEELEDLRQRLLFYKLFFQIEGITDASEKDKRIGSAYLRILINNLDDADKLKEKIDLLKVEEGETAVFFEPTNLFIETLKEMFHPDKSNGEVYLMYKSHKMSKETYDIIWAYFSIFVHALADRHILVVAFTPEDIGEYSSKGDLKELVEMIKSEKLEEMVLSQDNVDRSMDN